MGCLKQKFVWGCGCITTQHVHGIDHKKSDGDECHSYVEIEISMGDTRFGHVKNRGTKEERKVNCNGNVKLEGGGESWGAAVAAVGDSEDAFASTDVEEWGASSGEEIKW